MDISLEKIDMIRERTGLNYAEAKELLEEANGSVVDALVLLEEEEGIDFEEGMEDMQETLTEKVVSPVKRIFNKSTRTRIRVSNEDGTLLEFPATLGIAGALLAPRATALSAMALLMAHYTLDVDVPEYNPLEWQQ